MSKKKTVGKKIWDSRKEILEGIKNRVFQSEAVEAISTIRFDICKDCKHYDVEGTTCAVPGTSPCCSECGCSLAFKTRSLSSSCPRFLWDKILSDEEDDMHDDLNPEYD